jgi:hypothetical protein
MLLRGLKPGVVISSASVGSVPFREVSEEEWQSGIDKVVGDLS